MHDEELAACGIWVHCTSHGKNSRCVCQIIFKMVLRKFTFDGVTRTAHACTVGTTALYHEATDDSVENQTVIKAVFNQADKVVYCIWGDFRI